MSSGTAESGVTGSATVRWQHRQALRLSESRSTPPHPTHAPQHNIRSVLHSHHVLPSLLRLSVLMLIDGILRVESEAGSAFSRRLFLTEPLPLNRVTEGVASPTA